MLQDSYFKSQKKEGGIKANKSMSLPKEQAIFLVTAIYYKMPLFITEDDIREERESAKNIALLFCESYIDELKTLRKTAQIQFHIQFWTDTITEIKGL